MRPVVVVLAGVLCLASCSGGSPTGRRATAPVAASTAAPTITPTAGPTDGAHNRLTVRRMSWRLPHVVAREAVLAAPGTRSVVVAGGLLPGDTSSSSAYRLDLLTGRTVRLPDLAVPVHDTAGMLAHRHPAVVGGGNAAEQSTVQRQVGRDWRIVGHLPGPRSDLSTVTIGQTTYVVGGYDGTSAALPDVLASTDGRSWRNVARLPVPVRYAAVVAVGANIFVLGGERNGVMVRTVQRVDPATGRADVVTRLRQPVGHAMAVAWHGRVLLAGGRRSAQNVTDRMWWLGTTTGEVRPAGRLPMPLADAGTVQEPGGNAYLLGGETPAVTDAVLRLRLPRT